MERWRPSRATAASGTAATGRRLHRRGWCSRSGWPWTRRGGRSRQRLRQPAAQGRYERHDSHLCRMRLRRQRRAGGVGASGRTGGRGGGCRRRRYFADQGANMVRKIAPDGTIAQTIAGTGEAGTRAMADRRHRRGCGRRRKWRWTRPGICTSRMSRIADRKVTPGGTITTVAGSGVSGYGGDGAPATDALLAFPDGVAVDAAGDIYIADTATHRIRKVTPMDHPHRLRDLPRRGSRGMAGRRRRRCCLTRECWRSMRKATCCLRTLRKTWCAWCAQAGTIEQVAGTGVTGSTGDGGPATAAELSGPWGLAVDAQGDILMAT